MREAMSRFQAYFPEHSVGRALARRLDAVAVVDEGAFAILHVDGPCVLLYWAAFVGRNYDFFRLGIKTEQLHHNPFPTCQLADVAVGFLSIVKVEVVVSVALTLEHEHAAVPWQEHDRMKRFYIFVVGFSVDFGNLLACLSIVAHQSTVVLVSVELKHVDCLLVGAPCDVGEISVGGVDSLKIACRAV